MCVFVDFDGCGRRLHHLKCCTFLWRHLMEFYRFEKEWTIRLQFHFISQFANTNDNKKLSTRTTRNRLPFYFFASSIQRSMSKGTHRNSIGPYHLLKSQVLFTLEDNRLTNTKPNSMFKNIFIGSVLFFSHCISCIGRHCCVLSVVVQDFLRNTSKCLSAIPIPIQTIIDSCCSVAMARECRIHNFLNETIEIHLTECARSQVAHWINDGQIQCDDFAHFWREKKIKRLPVMVGYLNKHRYSIRN